VVVAVVIPHNQVDVVVTVVQVQEVVAEVRVHLLQVLEVQVDVVVTVL
jgi:hypothetical protein